VNVESIDWAAIVEGWRLAFEGMAKAANKAFAAIRGAMQNVMRVSREIANDEVRVSGLEARYFIRGGHAQDIDALVQDLLTDPARQGDMDEVFLMDLLTPASRARLAAAAIQGYTAVHDEPVESLAWHRMLGTTRVLVGRA
jgi:hypothetical protein